MLMLERDGTVIQPERTTGGTEVSFLEAIDGYIADQIDRYLSDVAARLGDLDQQRASVHRGPREWLRQRG